eukprot:4353350-Prymnesium_polylepis.2
MVGCALMVHQVAARWLCWLRWCRSMRSHGGRPVLRPCRRLPAHCSCRQPLRLDWRSYTRGYRMEQDVRCDRLVEPVKGALAGPQHGRSLTRLNAGRLAVHAPTWRERRMNLRPRVFLAVVPRTVRFPYVCTELFTSRPWYEVDPTMGDLRLGFAAWPL